MRRLLCWCGRVCEVYIGGNTSDVRCDICGRVMEEE